MRYYIQLVDLTAVEAECEHSALQVAASKLADRLAEGKVRLAIVDRETELLSGCVSSSSSG